jgi:hypothetical protein
MAQTKKKLTPVEQRRKRVLRQRKSKLKLTGWEGTKGSLSGQICEFLHQMAVEFPHETILYEEIAQALDKLRSRPVANNARVIQIRNNISIARRVMRRDYKRDIVGVPGVGVRATVDDLDMVQTAAVRDAKSVDRAARKFSDTCEMVNTEEFKLLAAQTDNPEEFTELTRWWVNDVQVAVKKLRASIKNDKLLPQPPELEKE